MLKITVIAAGTLAALFAAAPPAQAYWGRGYGWGWRPPVLVAPVAVLPPPPAFVAPPSLRGFWVPAHYTVYGAFIPGHWR